MSQQGKGKKVGDSVILTAVGRLGKDPESRGEGTFSSLAVGQRVQQDGEWKDGVTMWFDLAAWNDSLENFSKGDRVLVHGLLGMREYDGKKYMKITVLQAEAFGASKPKEEQKIEEDDDLPF